MRNPLLTPSTVAALCGSLVFAFAAARADDDHHQGGDDVQGVENLETELTLTPTADAPAGAGGNAEIRAENEDGLTTATLKIEPQGLTAGTYTINYTTKSDGASNVLGAFDVVAPPASNDDGEVDDAEDTEIVFGTQENPFPTGFNPLDLATLTISDAGSIALLTGDFTNVLTAEHAAIHANVKITPGVTDLAAFGHVVINARAKRGSTRGLLLLVAKNLPPSTDVALNLDGTDVFTTKTNSRGQLKLLKMPAASNSKSATKVSPRWLPQSVNIFTIHSLSVHDAASNELLHASF